MSRISPILLLVIVILAAIFFVFGLLLLLVRYFKKRQSFSSISQSNRNNTEETLNNSHSFQRQLQHLFSLHDSGLDQSLIEKLPIFYYKDIIMDLKEPFDCAVCLCEFSDKDMLRLLPSCGHAFHIHCIDTWLLSNSTCPLCRNENPLDPFDELKENLNCISNEMENEYLDNHNGGILQENGVEPRVFSIRLGKFRSIVNEEKDENGDEIQEEETRSCNLDGRRCYSMGTFQYVVGSELQVALSTNANMKRNFASNIEKDGKKISATTRGESYSVSKIWLWSKKDSTQSVAEDSVTNRNATSTSIDRPKRDMTQLV